MISEALQKIITWGSSDEDGDSMRVDSKMPGWITTGYWAARALGEGELYVSRVPGFGVPDLDGQLAGVIDKAISRPLVTLAEDKALRIERVEQKERYRCDGCECGKCDGSGYWESVETSEAGQAVFRGIIDEKAVAVLNPIYAPILDGLTVKASAPDLPNTPLMGYDEHGELVAIVMPMKVDPRDPAMEAKR